MRWPSVRSCVARICIAGFLFGAPATIATAQTDSPTDFDPIAINRSLEINMRDQFPPARGRVLLREIKEALRELFVGLEYGGDARLPDRYTEHHRVTTWRELRVSLVEEETVLFSVQILDLIPSQETVLFARVLVTGDTAGVFFVNRKTFRLQQHPAGWAVTDFDG